MTGTVYKISGYGLTYYGSTNSSLGTRKSHHKNCYNRFVRGLDNRNTAHDILEKGDEWDIEAVEEDIEDENLLSREGFYIKNYECVNKRIAGRTKKEYYEDNEEKMKAYKSQWSKDNREKIKISYHANKDTINLMRRSANNNTESKLLKSQQDAIYRDANRDKIKAQKNAKVICPTCNLEYSKSNLNRHIKTKHTEK